MFNCRQKSGYPYYIETEEEVYKRLIKNWCAKPEDETLYAEVRKSYDCFTVSKLV